MTIKELRKQYNITQAKLSEITNIPIRTISNWETGNRMPAPYIPELVAYRLHEWNANDVEFKTLEELKVWKMMSENSVDIDLLTDIYKELEDRNFIEQANGSLSALANLRDVICAYGEGTLSDNCFFDYDDCFFALENIAKKYGDWDEDFNCRAYHLSNFEMFEKLDDEDKQEYIKFLKSIYDNYIF